MTVLDGPFALAVATGMAATVNPCGFALLPAYLAAFVGDSRQDRTGMVSRAFAVSAAMTAGFVTVFGLFGVIITPLATSVERYLPWATIVIGVAIVVAGVSMVAGREITARIPKLNRGGRDDTIGSMFVFGISYAIASLSCTIGPFLAVTSTTFRRGNVVSGIVVFVAYGLGMAVIVTAVTVAVALARTGLVGQLRRALPYISRVSGALMVAAGAYVAWYGWFEIRTLDGGNGQDPVVGRALKVQAWLEHHVIPADPARSLGWIVAALAIVAAATLVARRRTQKRKLSDAYSPSDDAITPPSREPGIAKPDRTSASASALVIGSDPALGKEFLEVPVRQPEPQIPADR